jgi:hypothetical protein
VKLYLFLRSIVWTSVISVITSALALITAFTAPGLAIPLGLISIALAVLTPKRDY